MIPGFVKLFHLGDKTTEGIWDGEIEVTEKIDGSQFNFGNIDGELKMRSKNCEVFLEDSNKMFNKAKAFAKWAFDNDLLVPKYVYHGEYLNSPRHNTLEYAKEPRNNFVLFGISMLDDRHQDFFDNIEFLTMHADRLQCDVVPCYYRGPGKDFVNNTDIKEFLNKESFLGKAQIEGFVVKNYSKQVWVGGKLFPILCAKYVSTAFKEKHVEGWKTSNPSALEQIGAAFKSDARWLKAIQRLRDEGKLTNTPKDIGPLLGSIIRDLEEEETENIKDMLWKLFSKNIKQIATKGFPEFYKEKLLTDSINSGQTTT